MRYITSSVHAHRWRRNVEPRAVLHAMLCFMINSCYCYHLDKLEL